MVFILDIFMYISKDSVWNMILFCIQVNICYLLPILQCAFSEGWGNILLWPLNHWWKVILNSISEGFFFWSLCLFFSFILLVFFVLETRPQCIYYSDLRLENLLLPPSVCCEYRNVPSKQIWVFYWLYCVRSHKRARQLASCQIILS